MNSHTTDLESHRLARENTTAELREKLATTRSSLAWIRINWMERDALAATLENHHIDPGEDSVEELRQATFANIQDGEIQLDELPETGTGSECLHANEHADLNEAIELKEEEAEEEDQA